MISSRRCCPTRCPLSPSLRNEPESEFCALLGLSPSQYMTLPGTVHTAFQQERKTGPPSAWRQSSQSWTHLPRSPETSQLGNEMTHARGQTFPLLSSSCFLNKQTEPTQTLLYSTDGSLENTKLLPNYRLCRSPVSPASMQTLLPLAWSLPGVRDHLPPTAERSQIGAIKWGPIFR